METVKNRRSIRKYAGKPVDEELLRRLLEVSERTQTMGNMQLYSVVVTRSEEMKKRLAPAHFNQPMVTQAPVILTICADFNRTVKWAEQRKPPRMRCCLHRHFAIWPRRKGWGFVI